jgi:mRNA interferase RelE/StbE
LLYSVQIERPALKSLKKLPPDAIKNIKESIEELKQNPRPNGYKKLKGNENLYRIRSGNYRVIYQIQEKVLIVLVVRIGDRKDVYCDI